MLEFIGLDGEGFEVAGQHEYVLLTASTGESIENVQGLTTLECIDYLLMLGRTYPKATFVSFVFSYDVNMILRDVQPPQLRYLAHFKKTFVHTPSRKGITYKIEYIPRKLFILTEYLLRGNGKIKPTTKIVVYDVHGFFQTSFVVALKAYGVGSEKAIARMSKMKAARAQFTVKQFDAIKEYNLQECKYLVELMNKLKSQLDFLQIPLRRWHGAGAIANQILKSFHVDKHIARPGEDTPFENAVMSSYFGGRIQSLQVGQYSDLYAYDIISAYPYAIRDLPSLNNSTIIPVKCFMGFGVYRCKWNVPTDYVTPFPWRDSHGCINYPQAGEGWYWSPEVEAAMELFPGQINVKEGFAIKTLPYEKPCWFVQDFFDLRARLKSEGHPAQKALKLCLNSLYGKFAQGQGMNPKRLPTYQCYIYAGLITSTCRAMILRAAMQQPTKVIAFATDSIMSLAPINLPNTKELGSWESRAYDAGFFLKPGFYRLSNKDENTDKVRGFPPSSVDFKLIEAEFAERGVAGKLTFYCRQFITMKRASEHLPWRTWHDSPRKLSFWPTHGDPDLTSTKPMRYRLLPPTTCEGMSKVFVPKTSSMEPETLDIEGETCYTIEVGKKVKGREGPPILPWTFPAKE